MNKKALLLLIPFAAGTLVGCTPKDQPKTECDSAVVHVDKETASMKVGDTLQLNATIDKEGCSITWSSSAVDIASVDSSGIVTANAVGTADIIANGKTVCVVTVTQDGPGPVNPKHAGTEADPYDSEDAALVANSLEEGGVTSESFYIKGTVEKFEETFSTKYGNYSFNIGNNFICWRLMNGPEKAPFAEGDIEIGDEVVVFAQIKKFHQDAKDDKPARNLLETEGGYVVSVKKDGPQEPSLSLDKSTASLKIGKTVTISATVKNTDEAIAWSIEGTAASMVVSGDNKSVTLTGESVGSATVKAKLNNAGLEKSCVVSVSEPAPVGQGAVYTFENDKESAQNWSAIGEDGFKKATVGEGDEIITGYKDGENAYIGGNGGSGDTAWNIWNCLKVGKSGSQGKITIKLDSDLSFESIKFSVIGARDDGTLVVNGISKDVTKKATKDDLEPMVLEYDIGGGISELTLTSKPNPGSKENFGICITRIEFVGRQEAVLESISADITKKSYEVGDELSLDGLTVTGHYSDGNDAPITEGITTSLAEGHIMDLEDTSLTVYVGEIHTDIELTVTDPTLVLDYIAMSGVKETYYAGQKLGAITVKAHYIGGTEIDVSNQAVLKIGDTVVDADHIMAIGETSVVASFEDETDELTFTVVEDTVTELTIATEAHRNFYTGDEFVGEKINASYASGKVEEDVNATFVGYDMDNAGEQTVTVSYGGAGTTYGITVNKLVVFAKATEIEVGDVVAFVTEGASMELTGFSTTSTIYGIGTAYNTNIKHTYEIEVVAGSEDGTFAFKVGDNYISWSSGNSLNCSATEVNKSSSWKVSFNDSGNATIANANDETRVIWWNVNSPRFACYTGKSDGDGYKAVQIYKEPAAPAVLQEIVVSSSEHREFYLNSEFVPETIMAKFDKGADVDVTDKAVFEDYDMKTAGEQKVKVSYGGKETSYDITVFGTPAPAIKSISINADGMLKEYCDEDDIDLNGVKVYAHYESGDPVELDASKYSLTCSPEKADIDSKKTTLTATLLDTEAGVEPAILDVDLTVTAKPAPVEDVVDTLDADLFIEKGVTGKYTAFENVVSTAGIKYSGSVARNGEDAHLGALQINTSSNKSCIYTMLSNREVKKISATFNGTNTKKISIYGKNASFSSNDTAGATLLGELSATGSFDVTGSYRNILIVSNGAVYLDDISVSWSSTVLENKAESVSLNETEKTIGVGEDTAFDLVAFVDGIGDPGSVTWSSNSEHATVTDGHVVGVSAGDATITAASVLDPSLKATCAVTVSAGPVEKSIYKLDTTDEATKGTNSGYGTTGEVTYNDVTWNAKGNMTMNPWRIGGKKAAIGGGDGTEGVQSVYTKTAISSNNIDKVVFTAGNVTITTSKLVISVFADAADAAAGSGDSLVEQKVFTENLKADGVFEFARTKESWAGCYFRFDFYVTNNTTSAKFWEFKTVEFFAK
ncbi:MAG: bacterial Ig-like domain-containing protein [Firmicutes bacterium]|nr:bacterial Ig-like domain-containing protein [Candidatus Fiminaster equi]